MKVLVTDYAWDTLEPEEKVLSQIGAQLVVAPSDDEMTLLELAPVADAMLTCWADVNGKVIDAATKCQVIGRYGVGVDNVSVDEATRRGIVVTNVPTYCIDEVSDHAMALLLSCARKTCFYTRAVKHGHWDVQLGTKMFRVRGKTLGLIGFGQNGRAMVPKAKAFGLNVLVYDPFVSDSDVSACGAEPVTLEKLLEAADFVSLHLPLISSTHHFLTAESFKRMKSTAYLINTSRGGIVDTVALTLAIEQGEIAGAGLDVLPSEPPSEDDPILELENVVLTPHAAFNSVESLLDLQRLAAENIAAVLSGTRPQHIVNEDVLETPVLRARF